MGEDFIVTKIKKNNIHSSCVYIKGSFGTQAWLGLAWTKFSTMFVSFNSSLRWDC